MKTLYYYLIIVLVLLSTSAHATITNGNIPNVYANTCGPSGTSPCSHNSPAWTDGTNVGIGTSVPGMSLDVIGTVRSSLGYVAGNGAGGNFNCPVSSSLCGLSSTSGYTPQSQFDVNGGITSTGIGIGTEQPQYPLQIVQTAGQAGTGLGYAFQTCSYNGGTKQCSEQDAFGDYFYANGIVEIGNTGNITGVNNLSVGGNVAIGSTSANQGLVVNATQYNIGNVGIGTNFPGEQLDINGNERLNGNLGVGINAPGQKIDVNGTVRMTGFNLSTSPVSGYVLTSNSSGTGTWAVGGGGGGSSLWNTINTNDVYEANSSTFGNVGIGTSGTINSALEIQNIGSNDFLHVTKVTTGDTFVITNGGNVGIGTLTPTATFQVNGTSAATTLQANGVGLGTIANNQGIGIDPANNTFTTAAMTITTAGNIGIGTSIPINKLQDTAGASIGYQNSTAPATGLIVAGNVGIGTTTASKTLQVATSDTGTYTGSLSSNPLSKVEISNIDSAHTNNNYSLLGFMSADTSNVVTNLGGVAMVTTSHTNGAVSSFLSFITKNAGTLAEGMRIDSSGNLGIGTPTPTATLEVAGTTRSSVYAGFNSIVKVTGNVSIGSTAPGRQLEVFGSPGTSGSVGERISNSNGRIYDLLSLGSAGSPANGFLIQDNTSSANRFDIDANGNVGIGSLTPGQLLDVFGTLRLSKLGGTLAISSGTNGCQGQGTLASGTVTISTTCTPSSSQGIFLQDATTGSLVNVGTPTVGTVTTGVSFVINSSNATDSSNVNWWILKSS